MSLEIDEQTPQLTKAERRAAKRPEAERIQAETAARERRTRRMLWIVIAACVLGLIGLGIWQFVQSNARAAEAVEFDMLPIAEVTEIPAHTTADGGIAIDQAGVATGVVNAELPTVAVYLDYHCPWCAVFEQVNLQSMLDMAAAGEANVVFHPIAFLDGHSLNAMYSTRSTAAAAWVADRAPEAFVRFHDLMFQHQPASNTAGLTNAEIAELAREAGVPEDVAAGIADGTATNTFGQWATSVTGETFTNIADFQGTPTILINGEQWEGDFQTPGALREAVLATTAG